MAQSHGGGESPSDGPRRDAALVRGTDGRARCWWAADSILLERYHDHEWGHGPTDENGLFERLCLEAFQAGLSWRLVLERREALRSAFLGFDPLGIARFTEADIDRVLTRPGVIRNRMKVAAIVHNASVLIGLHAMGSGLAAITSEVIADVPIGTAPRPRERADVPSSTMTSAAFARRLRRAGWRFIGPVTAYAYLQAAGWVDDHLLGCVAAVPQPVPPLR